jgi:NADH-quinone oxidoreductase subunit C
MATVDAVQALKERFPDLNVAAKSLCTYLDGRESGQLYVTVPANRLLEVCRFLRDNPQTKFEQLSDVTCVDYLNYPESDDVAGRFGVIYSLLSLSHNHRLWLKVFVDDPNPAIPSLTALWPGANWTEREVFDMFGISFSGHPDLRRILTPDGFRDHPLRKDYPLCGKGEREQFPVITRESA